MDKGAADCSLLKNSLKKNFIHTFVDIFLIKYVKMVWVQ